MIEVVLAKKSSRSWDEPARPGGPVGDRVTYVGHATVLIEMDGVRLLTDPVLRRRVGPLRRHGAAPVRRVTEGIDAILISHLHHDHADVLSLRRLSRTVPVLAAPGAGDFLS